MGYKENVRKIVSEVCRLLLGGVFIFSGITKAVDPVGGAIKIDDYLVAFGLDKLRSLSTLLSFNLSAVEFLLGVCMLLGVYRRYTTFLTLLLMCFMTPLTFYLALFNPVSDCGCFGDALVLTNWQTFYKNILLLAAAIYVFVNNQRLSRCYTYHAYWFVALWAYVFVIGFAYRNYAHLPIIDFRPYKIGANIPELMSIPEGAPQDEYKYSFIYEKDGVQKEFSLENVPTDDSTWIFVDSKTELLKRGYVPPVTDFLISDERGEEVTGRLLDNPKGMFLLIAPRLERADDGHIDEINDVYDYAIECGLDFYCVTGSSSKAIAEWSDRTGAEYPFLTADVVLLKTMIHSNPGLMLLRKGTILMKWHYNDIPKEEDLPVVITDCLEGNVDLKAKEDARLETNVLTFAVPLLLVWVYDVSRNRYRRKRKRD